jgi:hypothetical protein
LSSPSSGQPLPPPHGTCHCRSIKAETLAAPAS